MHVKYSMDDIDIVPSIDYSSLPVTVKSGAVLTSPNVMAT